MDNILKKQLDCIGEDFLGRIFCDLGKPEREALKHLFGKVVAGKSTLVTDIARPLRADSSREEAKRAQEVARTCATRYTWRRRPP